MDPVKLGALALVNRHGIDRLVRGKTYRRDFADPAIGGREKNAGAAISFQVGKSNSDVAIEQFQIVIVDRDKHGSASGTSAVADRSALFP